MNSAQNDASLSTTSTPYTRATQKGKEKALSGEIVSEPLVYRTYRNEEEDLEAMMRLVEQELSEP